MKPLREPVFDAAGRPIRDALGRAFDAIRFHPRLDKLKRFVNARAGRRSPGKAKRPAAAQSTFPTMDTATAPAEAAPDFSDIDRAAGAAAPAASGASGDGGEGGDGGGENSTSETIIGIIQTALVLIGDDEGVLTAQEKRMLRPPLERVLKKYDIGAAMLPAELDLALAMATILIVRLQKPKTATWFAKVKMWFGGRVAEVKGAALAKRVEAANS